MKHLSTIYGPPGTGKTRRLVEITSKEVLERSARCCYLSYTKSAAEEAANRVKALTAGGHSKLAGVMPSTIHSLAFNAISANRAQVVDLLKLDALAKHTGIPFKRNNIEDTEPLEGDDYLAVLSLAGNKGISSAEAYKHLGAPGEWARFEMFETAYTSWKREYGFLDFNDMLVKFVDLPESCIPLFEVVMLDEAQDCSNLQWKAINRVAEKAARVYVAGDDDQAIFEWNGANPHGMAEFADRNLSAGGRVTVLDHSWRVPAAAHFMAQEVIDLVETRVAKKFNHSGRDGEVIRYGSTFDIDWQTMRETGALVLVRDRFRSLEVERILNQALIPYRKLGGFSPWQGKWADTIRATNKWIRGEQMSEAEIQRVQKAAQPRFRDVVGSRFDSTHRIKWWDIIEGIPPYLMHFYTEADMDAEQTITLSTIHQAKGREHHTVVLDAELSTRALDQIDEHHDSEVRVQYVGLTRTSGHLHICGDNPILQAAEALE